MRACARSARPCSTHPATSSRSRPGPTTINTSARTLARRFQSETGLSFGAWRQQARVLEAMGRLGGGEPVTQVALDLGYESVSAFSAMFRAPAPRQHCGTARSRKSLQACGFDVAAI